MPGTGLSSNFSIKHTAIKVLRTPCKVEPYGTCWNTGSLAEGCEGSKSESVIATESGTFGGGIPLGKEWYSNMEGARAQLELLLALHMNFRIVEIFFATFTPLKSPLSDLMVYHTNVGLCPTLINWWWLLNMKWMFIKIIFQQILLNSNIQTRTLKYWIWSAVTLKSGHTERFSVRPPPAAFQFSCFVITNCWIIIFIQPRKSISSTAVQ